MSRSIISFWSILIGIFFFISCDHKEPEQAISRLPAEDFDQFYDRFHKDLEFQILRIKFPVEGFKSEGSEQVAWTKDNWIPMVTKVNEVDTSEFKVNYKRTDSTYFQKIWIENSGFSCEYKFKLIENKWYLVYAMDMNN